MLLLLELDLGGSANLDHRDAARKLGEALLELLLVVVRRGLLDLRLDLRHARLDLGWLPRAINDGRVVLGRNDTSCSTEILGRDAVELAADLFRDHRSAGQHRDVAEHLLASVAEAWRLHRKHLYGAADLVHHQRGECLAVHILSDDQEWSTGADRLLKRWECIGNSRNLLVGNEDRWVVELCLHAIRVRHEVGRDVATVELHSLGVLLVESE